MLRIMILLYGSFLLYTTLMRRLDEYDVQVIYLILWLIQFYLEKIVKLLKIPTRTYRYVNIAPYYLNTFTNTYCRMKSSFLRSGARKARWVPYAISYMLLVLLNFINCLNNFKLKIMSSFRLIPLLQSS